MVLYGEANMNVKDAQPKKDWRPRRVVDMSSFTKGARRELHHLHLQVACSVPGGIKLDCVDGYNRVEIAEMESGKMSYRGGDLSIKESATGFFSIWRLLHQKGR